MLVLGRKPGERIVINNNIEVYIINGEDGQLKLGINAPREISIVRGEIIDRQNEALENNI